MQRAIGDFGLDGTDRTSHFTGHNGDDCAFPLLVGFRSCDPYAESAFDFFEVVDVQGDEFGAT
jgi:hypothetical protein